MPAPVTRAHLAADLQSLGLPAGAAVMVHTSLKALGWVVGGEQAVIEALRDAVGPEGTLVMPTQSWQLCDPAVLQETPPQWWPTIRENLPAYDPRVTPARTMGAVAELFRTLPGTLRSAHPHRSVSANGPLAETITAVHDLDCPSGERSPMRALYDADGQVLLLGASPAKTTVLHLAEHRADWPGKHLDSNAGPVLVDGKRTWVTYQELAVQDEDFVDVVEAFARETGLMRIGTVGEAPARLLPVRPLVDYAAAWFTTHRAA
ncbi:aminoglycoside N(3)-acetyltransferase [Salana multivorans]